MLAKKREGTAGLQVETAVDVSRDYHKLRYRPYRQNNSISSSKALLDTSVADQQPKEGYISQSPNHVHQPHHQSSSNNNNNNNNNNNSNQGNDQYQNHHHHHHHHHHHGSRLSRGSTHDIPDGRTSPAKVEHTRRERRTMSNKRSNSLFTQHVTQLQHLDNVPGSGQPSASTTTPTASTPTTATTPTPLPVSPDTAAATVTQPEYGSDRRKLLIQQRRKNGQFVGHGAICTPSDVGNASKVSGHPSQHHFPLQHQYHGHSQPQQHQNYQIAVGNTDYYTCHSNGNGNVSRGSDRTPKGLKNAPSLSKRAEKERQPEKSRPSSCSGSRDCPSRNGSFTIGTEPGNSFSDAGSIRGGGGGSIETSKKHSMKSGRGTPLMSEGGTSVKVTDPTDPGGGQNSGVFSHKPYHNQQKSSSHYQQNEDFEHRAQRTNGKVRTSETNQAKEGSNRAVDPLRSLMKWEYEDLYGHMHKSSSDRMTPVRSVRPKSAGVSARTHTAMIDSDDSSLDGDIEYVNLEELSDGEDAIVMTDSEVAAASSSSLAKTKQRVPKSWKDNSGVGIRRAYSMKDSQPNSFAKENPRHVNKISQESRRLRCNDSSGGKPETKWIFAEKKSQHSNYQKSLRRDSVDGPSNNSYHRHLNAKKDMFDLSSFKDNLSFSQNESLAPKCKKLGNSNVCFSVTGEQLAPEGLRQLKGRHCGPESTESPRNEKGETVPRRSSHAPFPRRLKPLFGNIVEDSES